MCAAGVRRVTFVLGTSAGGTGAHVRMLATGLARRGVEARVAGPSRTGSDLGLDAIDGVIFAPVEFGDRPRPADAKAVLALRRLLAAPGTRPDVAHAHGLRAGALTAIALAGSGKRSGKRRPALVVTVHNAPTGRGAARLVYLALERIVAHRADLVLAVSSDLEQRMRNAGARRVARAVVPAPDRPVPDRPASDQPACGKPVRDKTAPDTPVLAEPVRSRPAPGKPAPGKPARDWSARKTGPIAGDSEPSLLTPSEATTGEDRPLILAVGRLTSQKGFATLLQAATAWQHLTPRPRLLIAGDGPLRPALEAQAARLKVDAELPGHRADVPELLAAASVFVMPSLWEGQPLALQEALRAGVPIVASRAGGIPDLTGDAALLVEPGNAEQLGESVLSVLENSDLSGRLRRAGRRRADALPAEADAVTAVLAAYAGARE